MAILLVLGVLVLVAFVVVVRHSRNFRGSGAHFESELEDLPPELKLSKGYPGSEGGL